ncbi:MAG: fibronectin type III domain-containing protein, partial [Candidatus Muiribacteriota bacterium]
MKKVLIFTLVFVSLFSYIYLSGCGGSSGGSANTVINSVAEEDKSEGKIILNVDSTNLNSIDDVILSYYLVDSPEDITIISSDNLSLVDGKIVWDSYNDFPNTVIDIKLNITPADEESEAKEIELRVDNRGIASDSDSDVEIDKLDTSDFLNFYEPDLNVSYNVLGINEGDSWNALVYLYDEKGDFLTSNDSASVVNDFNRESIYIHPESGISGTVEVRLVLQKNGENVYSNSLSGKINIAEQSMEINEDIEISDLTASFEWDGDFNMNPPIDVTFEVTGVDQNDEWYVSYLIKEDNNILFTSYDDLLSSNLKLTENGLQNFELSIWNDDVAGENLTLQIRLFKDSEYSNALTANLDLYAIQSSEAHPQNIRVKERTSNSITVEWDRPTGIYTDEYLTGYRVEWR